MSARNSRPVTIVGSAHPELDSHTTERVADRLAAVAGEYGTSVSDLTQETVRAANSSAAGNDSTP